LGGYRLRFLCIYPTGFPASKKHVQVKKEHDTKVNRKSADFLAKHLYQSLYMLNIVPNTKIKQSKTYVEQIKTYFK
jgi:hypothetical protein